MASPFFPYVQEALLGRVDPDRFAEAQIDAGVWNLDDANAFLAEHRRVRESPEEIARVGAVANRRGREEATPFWTEKLAGELPENAFLRNLQAGGAGAVQSIGSALARPFSKDASREIWEQGQILDAAAAEADKTSSAPEWANAVLRGSSRSALQAVATAPLGGAGMIAGFAATEANESYHAAKAAGMTDAEARNHALLAGAIEGGVAGVFQATGMGGLEKYLGGGRQLTRAGMKSLLKQTGIALLQEVPEEILTEALHYANNSLAGLEQPSIEGFAKTMGMTLAQTILTVGATVGGKGVAAQPGLRRRDRAIGDFARTYGVDEETVRAAWERADGASRNDKQWRQVFEKEIDPAMRAAQDGRAKARQAAGEAPKGEAPKDGARQAAEDAARERAAAAKETDDFLSGLSDEEFANAFHFARVHSPEEMAEREREVYEAMQDSQRRDKAAAKRHAARFKSFRKAHPEWKPSPGIWDTTVAAPPKSAEADIQEQMRSVLRDPRKHGILSPDDVDDYLAKNTRFPKEFGTILRAKFPAQALDEDARKAEKERVKGKIVRTDKGRMRVLAVTWDGRYELGNARGESQTLTPRGVEAAGGFVEDKPDYKEHQVVMAVLPGARTKLSRARIDEYLGEGSYRVYWKGRGTKFNENSSEIYHGEVDESQIQLSPSQQAAKRYREEIEALPEEERTAVRKDSREFDALIRESIVFYPVEQGRATSVSQREAAYEEGRRIKDAREKAAGVLGVGPEETASPVGRAKHLEALRAWLEGPGRTQAAAIETELAKRQVEGLPEEPPAEEAKRMVDTRALFADRHEKVFGAELRDGDQVLHRGEWLVAEIDDEAGVIRLHDGRTLELDPEDAIPVLNGQIVGQDGEIREPAQAEDDSFDFAPAEGAGGAPSGRGPRPGGSPEPVAAVPSGQSGADTKTASGARMQDAPPKPTVQPAAAESKPQPTGSPRGDVAAIAEAPAPDGKEPWQLTRAEWMQTVAPLKAAKEDQEILDQQAALRKRFPNGYHSNLRHEMQVAIALREGRPVPRHVLADYPAEYWRNTVDLKDVAPLAEAVLSPAAPPAAFPAANNEQSAAESKPQMPGNGTKPGPKGWDRFLVAKGLLYEGSVGKKTFQHTLREVIPNNRWLQVGEVLDRYMQKPGAGDRRGAAKPIARIVGEWADAGILARMWDGEGNPHYAWVGATPLPGMLTLEEVEARAAALEASAKPDAPAEIPDMTVAEARAFVSAVEELAPANWQNDPPRVAQLYNALLERGVRGIDHLRAASVEDTTGFLERMTAAARATVQRAEAPRDTPDIASPVRDRATAIADPASKMPSWARSLAGKLRDRLASGQETQAEGAKELARIEAAVAKERGRDIGEKPTVQPGLFGPEEGGPEPDLFNRPQTPPGASASAENAARMVDALVMRLDEGTPITSAELFRIGDEAFGGTRAAGVWTSRQAYDLLDTAVNRHLEQSGMVDFADPQGTLERLDALLATLPTQTIRDTKQIELQQFSTPPTEAFVAVYALGDVKGLRVIEPSAGNGSLAVMARIAGAQVTVNEIDPLRRKNLSLLGFSPTDLNAEQLDNLLPAGEMYDAVVMNPPFSATGGRTKAHSTKYGARHVDQALRRVRDGGRLVAIVGRGMALDRPTFAAWWDDKMAAVNVRANMGVSGEVYKKYGTTFGNQILVLDKTGATPGANRAERVSNIVTGDDVVPSAAVEQLADVRREVSYAEVAEQPVRTDGGTADAANAGTLPGDRGARAPRPDDGNAGGRAGQPRPASAVRPAVPADVGPVAGTPGPGAGPGDVGNATSAGTRADRQPAAGAGRAEADAELPDGGSPGQSEPASLELDEADTTRGKVEADGIFAEYTVQTARFAGAKPHPGRLVESATMAGVAPAKVTAKPNLPASVVREGRLSDAQLEAVTYAVQRHEQLLPDGSRSGYWIADGTGVGKGREIAGIIYHNLRENKQKRALWLSVADQLAADAERDLAGVGVPLEVFSQSDTKMKEPLPNRDGVLFSKYTLLSQGWKKGKERFEQLAAWLGDDFEGVIVFDEAHKMKNAFATNQAGQATGMGGTDTGAMGLALQERWPKARVVYVSATGATVPRNLGYMSRMGLWGPGSPFETFVDFTAAVTEAGVSGMEMLARDLKAIGAYSSRSISYGKGSGVVDQDAAVEYAALTHELTAAETEQYNTLAELWQKIGNAMESAEDKTHDGRNVWSQFESAKQRFFLQLMMSYELPTMLEDVKAELAAGRSVVVNLFNTNESAVAEQVRQARVNNIDLDELEFTPKQMLVDLVERHFPIQEHEEVFDEDTQRTTWRPVVDAAGNPVINREAQEIQQKLLETIYQARMPDNPLDSLIDSLGPENVAEISGRKKRLERRDGEMKWVDRKPKGIKSSQLNEHETQLFQTGKKRVAIITGAAATGITLSSDMTATNQQRRVFYALQLSWSADTQMQAFGRVHRSNQAVPPVIKLCQCNLAGQKRLVNTTSARLASLGALSSGDRKAYGGSVFAVEDITDEYGQGALAKTYDKIQMGDIPGVETGRTTLERMGILDNDGNVRGNLAADVNKFLNRIMGLPVDVQNAVFESFYTTYREAVNTAITEGKYDVGVRTLPHTDVRRATKPEVVYRHPTGAETVLHTLEGNVPVFKWKWDFARDAVKSRGKGFAKRLSDGKVFAVMDDYRLEAIQSRDDTAASSWEIDEEGKTRYQGAPPPLYRMIPNDEARGLWKEQWNAIPPTEQEKILILTGAVFPIYDKLTGGHRMNFQGAKVQVAGETVAGLWMRGERAAALKQRLGIGAPLAEASAQDVMELIQGNGSVIVLDNGWTVRQARSAGEMRLEVTPANTYSNIEPEIESYGGFSEVVGFTRRYYLPMGDTAALARLMERHKAIRDQNAPRYSVRASEILEPRALTPQQTAEALRRAFPRASVTIEGDGYRIALANGEELRVVLTDRIEIDPDAFRRTYGRRVRAQDRAAAAWYDQARIIQLAKIAEIGDIDHESWHAAKSLANLTADELATLRQEFANEESEARAYQQWTGKMDSPFARIWAKVRMFFRRLASALGLRAKGDWEATFARVRSGQAFDQQATGTPRGETSPVRYEQTLSPEAIARDEAYAKAAANGDATTAEQLVEEAAKAVGYDVEAFHGTPKEIPFQRFDASVEADNPHEWRRLGFWFTDSRIIAKGYSEGTYFHPKQGRIVHAFLKMKKPMELAYDDMLEMGEKQIARLRAKAMHSGHDGLRIGRYGGAEGYDYVVFDPSQIKSADPFTYDDQGNLIPLSERFDPDSPDIRYSVPDGEERSRLGTFADSAWEGLRRAVGTDPDKGLRYQLRKWLLWGEGVGGRNPGLNRLEQRRKGAMEADTHALHRHMKKYRQTMKALDQLVRKGKVPQDVRDGLTALMYGTEDAADFSRPQNPVAAEAYDATLALRAMIDARTEGIRRQMGDILPAGLLAVMEENEGRYVLRAYRKFVEKGYVPSRPAREAMERSIADAIMERLDQAGTRMEERIASYYKRPENRQALRDYVRTGDEALLDGKKKSFQDRARRLRRYFELLSERLNGVLSVEQGEDGLELGIPRGALRSLAAGTAEWLRIKDTPLANAVPGRGSPQWKTIRKSFRKRKDLAKVLRTFYGEITDLAAVAQMTLARQNQILAADHFQRDLMDWQDSLANDDPDKFVYRAAWVGKDGRHFSFPLHDTSLGVIGQAEMFTDRATFELLQQVDDMPEAGLLRAWMKVLTVGRFAHTVANPPTIMRNFLTNFLQSFADGEWFYRPSYWRGWRAAIRILREAGPDLEDRIRSGVLSASARASELKANLSEAFGDPDTLTPHGIMQGVARLFAQGGRGLAWLYALGDNVHKLASYEAKISRGMAPEQALAEVRAAYPYYDMAPQAVTKFGRRMPFGPDFMSFGVEVIRNTINNWRQAARDARRGDLHALAGVLAIHGGVAAFGTAIGGAALAYALRKVTGDDWRPVQKDEEWAVRRMLPDHSRHGNHVFFADEDGAIHDMELEYISPYDLITGVSNILREPGTAADKGKAFGRYLWRQYGGFPMAVDTISQIVANHDPRTARPVYLATDDPADVAEKCLEHFATRVLVPSSGRRALRAFELLRSEEGSLETVAGEVITPGSEAAAALTPLRVRELVPEALFRARMGELSRALREARMEESATRGRVERGTSPWQRWEEATAQAEEATNQIAIEAAELVLAAERFLPLGTPGRKEEETEPGSIRRILLEAGFARQDVEDIVLRMLSYREKLPVPR